MIKISSGYKKKFNLCMLVYNNFLNDSRVQKEAQTLIKAGYQVTVVALLDTNSEPMEQRGEIRIVRVPINPWHQGVIRWVQQIGKVSGGESRLKRHLHCSTKSPRTPFTSIFKSLVYFLIVLAIFEALIRPETYLWISENNIFMSVLLCLLIFTRKLPIHLVARAKNFLKSFSKRSQRLRYSIASGLKKVLMPFHRQFCFLSFYINAYRFTGTEEFGIYHAHDLNTLPVAYCSAKRDGAKLVYDSHELYTERNKLIPSSKQWKCILGRIECFLIRQADAVITVNHTLARELAKRYKISLPSVVMNTPTSFGQAVNNFDDKGRLRTALSIPSQQKLMLYVGAITFNRGMETLIQSLAQLPDCYLACMGYGGSAYKRSLIDLAHEICVADRFAFFGPVPSDQVIHYAAGADIGVAPIANACLSYYYCSPNKLFEYMNAGLPVVASKFPELEKVIVGCDIGYTFDPSDPQDIACAIRRILDDPAAIERMSINAKKASRRYNWETESRKLLTIYKQL